MAYYSTINLVQGDTRPQIKFTLKDSNQDQRELLAKEIGKLETVFKAPQLPLTKNYKKENLPKIQEDDSNIG